MRVALALLANEQGYALVETFEVGGSIRGDLVLHSMEALVVRLGVAALVVSGPVDWVTVDEVATRLRLMVFTIL